jgi:parvulin-like peptidyl-prolyl isomerase
MDAFLNGKLQNEITNDKSLSEDAKKQAESILAEIKGGADFAETAKKYSEDTDNASKGGDLGTIEKNQMVPQFEEAAYKLNVGEVSDVVETVYGYHIIKVTAIDGEKRNVSHILIKARDFDWWIADQTKKAKVSYWVK